MRKIKTSFGYQLLCIGNMQIVTIKLKVKNTFPVNDLPLGFTHRPSIKQDEFVIEFSSILDFFAIERIQRFDRMRLKYKMDRVIANHGGWGMCKGQMSSYTESTLQAKEVEVIDYEWNNDDHTF